MKQQYTITSLPPSPEAERRARMIKYTIAMSIRVVCIFLMLFAQGWWLAVCAAGAIFLPYIAVVLANVGGGETGKVDAPGLPELGTATVPTAAPAADAPEPDASDQDDTGQDAKEPEVSTQDAPVTGSTSPEDGGSSR